MNNTRDVCFDKDIFILYIFIFSIIIFIIFAAVYSIVNNIDTHIPNPTPMISQSLPSMTVTKIQDPLKTYDYNTMYDPLKEPTRRVPRHQIPLIPIDYTSRGYTDDYTQFGILVSDDDKKSDNKILRLLGREIYPGANKYEYYTMINSGLDQIKIPVYTKRKDELYQDDDVYIKELGNKYKVHLYKYDAPRYYPRY
jgi:hypothetical protein